jgi:hypothetical protein
MAGYIRQSSFVDGDTITAAIFNNEYNQLVNAFSNTTGHAHDGTAAEGPVIGLIGDAGETSPNNKVLIDTTNNYIEFYVEVSSAPVQQLYIANGAIVPVTDSDVDLGTSSLYFKDTYTDTVTTTGNVTVGGNLTVTGNATISGNLTFGDADTDSINLAAEIDSDIIPNTDGTYDLGSATKEWQDLYIDGTANIDSLVADTADIDGGTIDGATIATSDITVGAGKTLDVSSGTLTLADDQISGDKVEGGTIAATTITTLTSTTGNVTNVNATTVDTTNIEVTNIKAKDGTAAGSIADSTGVVTLASSVLTTTDINGGTIDGVTIGGTTAGAVTFTDLSDGTITVTAFVDEDNMVSDSATLVPTQQSVKAYVDSQVTAQDLDFQGDTGGALSIDLDSETLTVAGGTGIDTSGALNTLTVAIDSTVATLTGSQTLTNKTLTSPVINTGVSGTAVLDDDTFATASATTLATSESIKAYVDTTVAATNEVVEDTTPQLGGDLDLNSNDIIGTGNINNTGTITTDGLTVDGAVTVNSNTTTAITATQNANTDINGVMGIRINNSTGTTYAAFGNSGADSVAITAGDAGGTGNTSLTLKTATSGSEKSRLNIGSDGDISFYEDTGTTAKFFWDASAESLELSGSGGLIIDSDGVNGALTITNPSSDLIQFTTGTSDDIAFVLSGSERVRFDSSGNVGIGTSSPAVKLAVSNNGAEGIEIVPSGGGEPIIQSYNRSTSAFTPIRLTGSDLKFYTGTTPSETMRIDSSGNLLVGTTTTDRTADDGILAASYGFVDVSRSSNISGRFTRRATDGTIVDFRKDSTTVGSIGVHTSSVIGVSLRGSLSYGGIGLPNDRNTIWPINSSSAPTDNVMDIGSSSVRFKDLYLSGGVYLGGTVAANKLDDYEEGTWSPAFNEQSAGSGTFTKVGRFVNVQGTVTCDANGSASGALAMTGFPFSVVSGSLRFTLSMVDMNSSAGGNSVAAPFNGQAFFMYDDYVRTSSTGSNPYYNHNLLKIGTVVYIEGSFLTTA